MKEQINIITVAAGDSAGGPARRHVGRGQCPARRGAGRGHLPRGESDAAAHRPVDPGGRRRHPAGPGLPGRRHPPDGTHQPGIRDDRLPPAGPAHCARGRHRGRRRLRARWNGHRPEPGPHHGLPVTPPSA